MTQGHWNTLCSWNSRNCIFFPQHDELHNKRETIQTSRGTWSCFIATTVFHVPIAKGICLQPKDVGFPCALKTGNKRSIWIESSTPHRGMSAICKAESLPRLLLGLEPHCRQSQCVPVNRLKRGPKAILGVKPRLCARWPQLPPRDSLLGAAWQSAEAHRPSWSPRGQAEPAGAGFPE